MADLRRALLPVRHLAGRLVPGRHRGLLRPPDLRGQRSSAPAPGAPAGRGAELRPARRPAPQAQSDRGIPALGRHRSGLEPRRDLGPRHPHDQRPGPSGHRAGPLPGGRHGAGHARHRSHPRRRHGPHRDHQHHRRPPSRRRVPRRRDPRGRAVGGAGVGGRAQPGPVAPDRGPPGAVVAPGPGRTTALRRGPRRRRGRADERPAGRHHRFAPDPDAALCDAGKRRAAVSEGRQPRTHPAGPRRGHTGRGPPRRGARLRRRPRPPAGPRPRGPPGAVRRGRPGRFAALAGPAPRVGVRPGPPPSRTPGPPGRRPSRPPPRHRHVVRARRAVLPRSARCRGHRRTRAGPGRSFPNPAELEPHRPRPVAPPHPRAS